MGRSSRLWLIPVAAAVLVGSLGCSANGNSSALTVGRDGTGGGGNGGSFGLGGNGTINVTDAGLSKALAVHVEQDQVTVTIVTVACDGGCADVEAFATGGYAPYTYAWEDGSTSAERHVCPTATTSYRVSATDTGATSGEFPRPPETVSAPLTARVFACPTDGGVKAVPPQTDAAACDLGGVTLPEELMPDIFGKPAYFGNGALLPAGRYRLSYVDGCMEYASNYGLGPWTVQGAANYEYVVIGASTSDTIALPPGTVGPGIGTGYPTFDSCVTANKALPPLDFDFAGGKLGIWQNDFQPSDNIAGTDGRNPTWRLSFLGSCP